MSRKYPSAYLALVTGYQSSEKVPEMFLNNFNLSVPVYHFLIQFEGVTSIPYPRL